MSPGIGSLRSRDRTALLKASCDSPACWTTIAGLSGLPLYLDCCLFGERLRPLGLEVAMLVKDFSGEPMVGCSLSRKRFNYKEQRTPSVPSLPIPAAAFGIQPAKRLTNSFILKLQSLESQLCPADRKLPARPFRPCRTERTFLSEAAWIGSPEH